MENPQVERKTKSNNKSASYATLRVKKTTRKRVMDEVSKANRKDWGKRVKADELVLLAISRITDSDIAAIQEASMSHADRLERDYREHVAKHGPLSKDDYLGKRLSREIPSPKSEGSNAEYAFPDGVEKNGGK